MQLWYYLLICLPSGVCLGWTLWFLFLSRNNDKAKTFLGWMMFVGFILYLVYIPYFLHRFSTFVLLLPVYTTASLLVYPMYNQYIRLLVEENRSQSWQKMYLPAVVFGILLYINLLLLDNAGMQKVQLVFQDNSIAWNQIGELPILSLLFLYGLSRVIFTMLVVYTVIMNFRLIHRYQSLLAGYYSDPESHSIHWLNYILAGMILTSIYSVVANSIGIPFFLNHPLLLTIPSISISLLIFFLGYFGNRIELIELLENEAENLETNEENDLVFGELFVSKFQQKLIVEKAFLIPGIKITTLCEQIDTNRTYLSVFINRNYQRNFCSLINKLRIEHSIQLLDQESIGKYSMNYLSEKCGFSSINTFYRTFQKEYGMTPGQYLKHREQSISDD